MNALKTTRLSQTLRFFFIGCLLLFAGAPVPSAAKIVYCVDGDIFVMNDDGSRRRRLTHTPQATHRYPRWSPDGKKIAFTRYMDKTKRQTSGEVFVMNADGTDPQRLTDNNVFDGYPSWSPDGEQLAFTSGRSSPWEVFVIDLATRDVRQITGFEGGAGSGAADWSPDGAQIVFERFLRVANGINPKTIYVMSATGEQQRPLLTAPPRNGPITLRYFPRWSADGQRILFYESTWHRDGDVMRVIVQRLGGVTREITDINDRLGNNFLIAGASWMENDRAILFSLKLWDKPASNYDLYRYTFETQGLRRLTREASGEKWPDWVSGALSVLPNGKLPTLWGELKQTGGTVQP